MTKKELIKLREDNMNSMPTMEILLQENKIIDALLVCMDALESMAREQELIEHKMLVRCGELDPYNGSGKLLKALQTLIIIEEMKL